MLLAAEDLKKLIPAKLGGTAETVRFIPSRCSSLELDNSDLLSGFPSMTINKKVRRGFL